MSSLGTVSRLTLALGIPYVVNWFLNKRLHAAAHDDSWNWDDEIVLITGGSNGIGLHMVEQFSNKRVKVIIFDINPPQHTISSDVFYYQVDVSRPEEIRLAAEKLRKKVGEPTVLINNAGVALGKNILDASKEKIKSMFNVNMMAHFWMVQEFLPAMIRNNHGHVVSMASIATFLCIAGNVDYSCTKAGVLAFHEGLSQELKHRYNAKNVKTSIFYPYWVRTPLIKNLTDHPTFKDTPLEPEYVAQIVVNNVLSGKGGQIAVPGYYGILAGIRGWPAWLQEYVRDSMKDFLRETTF